MEISTMSGKSLEKHDFPPLEWWNSFVKKFLQFSKRVKISGKPGITWEKRWKRYTKHSTKRTRARIWSQRGLLSRYRERTNRLL